MNSTKPTTSLPPAETSSPVQHARKLAQEFGYFLWTNKLALVGFIVIVILLIIALFAPLIAPYPEDIYDEVHLENKFLPPSADHWFGTDEMGRDIFSRVVYGTRISFEIGLTAIALSLVIGVPLGLIAGYFGRWVDEVIMRVCDIFLSFPPLLLAIAIVALLGPSITNMMIAISLSWWPWYTRLIRSQAVSIKERGFVEAAKTIGVSSPRIIARHVLPNSLSPVIVQASMDFGSIILTAASLSFLGLGAQAPTPEWGLMISIGRNFFMTSWWYITFPGLFILLTVMAFNFLGDGLRDYLDPKTRDR
ncbi:ABC transporter permease [Brevibacillus humidisoli]|uniref:nickel transporter permease n=1 Tax=Brevibacillus humidisoli TaxID=2895522 RepID=UPI001E4AF863|nr:nickel transporter permease [Brevibacillus humidisoli]UFJ40771.1 ABC transporter permease [Brevibacillus humidisoli]